MYDKVFKDYELKNESDKISICYKKSKSWETNYDSNKVYILKCAEKKL